MKITLLRAAEREKRLGRRCWHVPELGNPLNPHSFIGIECRAVKGRGKWGSAFPRWEDGQPGNLHLVEGLDDIRAEARKLSDWIGKRRAELIEKH